MTTGARSGGLRRRMAGAVATALLVPGASASVLYVDDGAPAGGDGLSWSTALRFLQDALVAAAPPRSGVSEIRVGAGTQRPDRDQASPAGTGDRATTFQLLDGVALRGGYAGFGAPDPDARDLDFYPTILNGDVFANDLPTDNVFHPSLGENIFHIVTAGGTNSSAVLDGFRISGGVAGFDAPLRSGGGLVCVNGTPTISQCTFTANLAFGGGGAIYFEGAISPALTSCAVSDSSGSPGGGICFYGNGGSLTLIDCLVNGNHAGSGGGGGMYVSDASLTASDCTFSGNEADIEGGAIYLPGVEVSLTGCAFDGNSAPAGAAVFYAPFGDTFDVAGCSFTGNSGGNGAGLYLHAPAGDAVVSQCSFEGNIATVSGAAIFYDSGALVVSECDFNENTAGDSGGAVYDDHEATYVACTFGSNHADSQGGAIYLAADARVIGCAFSANTAAVIGGAIGIVAASPRIVGCTFLQNDAGQRGGGAGAHSNGSASFVNCAFSGNSAGEFGGAACFISASPALANCALSGNSAVMQGGGIYAQQLTTVKVTNCIAWDNSDSSGQGQSAQLRRTPDSNYALNYSCVEGLTGSLGGTGNIGGDPQFVGGGDLRLLPGSPCIDAGDNWGLPDDVTDLDGDGSTTELTPIDLDGNPRFADDPLTTGLGCGVPAIVDMGPYEHPGAAAALVILGDLDADGTIGIVDFLGLLGAWGPCVPGCCLADLDINGSVGITDFLALLAHWRSP